MSTFSQDYQGSLFFVTDPICSWCWGMLPEWRAIMEEFQGRLQFGLRCAGLQVGSMKPLGNDQRDQLIQLWHRVQATTGQKFAFTFPDDPSFIYHSEVPCRALQIARQELQAEPWQLFHDMQEAFYLNGKNLGDLEVLVELIEPYGLDRSRFLDLVSDEAIIKATRDEFTWCKGQVTQVLPTVFIDLGQGPRLISGGYSTAEFLIPDIKARLTTH